MSEPQTTALSTDLAKDYNIKVAPKNVKLEVGKFYNIINGNGVMDVKVVAIRKLNNDVVVHYKYASGKDSRSFTDFSTNWVYNSVSLNTFKLQLLDYGSVDSIDLLYPSPEDTNDDD